MNLTPRLISGAIFLAALTSMLAAIYLQHVEGLEPCALCMTQRIFTVLVGAVALGAWMHNRHGRRWGPAIALTAAIGAGFSIRQLYLQHLPADQVPACGPGLEYMLDVFPMADVLKAMLMGTGNCAEVAWRFLGLTIPGWALCCFVAMFIGGVLMFRTAGGHDHPEGAEGDLVA